MAVDEIFRANALLPTLLGRQALSSSQQSALAVNETLQTFNSLPSTSGDPLLINEINPNLAVFLDGQELTISQQAALAANDALQNLTTPQQMAQESMIAVTAAEAVSNVTAGQTDTALAAATAESARVAVAVSGLNPTAPAVASTQIANTVAETTLASTGRESTAPIVPQAILDRNPIAVSVYEIRDQKPRPSEPKPRRNEVLPPLPIGRVRPVDRLVLRQEWERRKEQGRRPGGVARPPLEERAIREMIGRVNDDLAANGLPLRLVLAKNAEGYSMDIYDCSEETECRLAQEVPLDLNELLTILDNLQHETGIIINIKT